MIKGIESILLNSENARKLADFYKNVIGLKQTMEAEFGENNEELFTFEMTNSSALVILDHSKMKGKNGSPERYILNFEVDDIYAILLPQCHLLVFRKYKYHNQEKLHQLLNFLSLQKDCLIACQVIYHLRSFLQNTMVLNL